VVGYAALKHFASRGNCEVTVVSRRRPRETFGARFLSVDLTDARACADALGGMTDVTRLVYAALHEKPGLVPGWLEDDQVSTNQRMLRNLFEPLEKASGALQHVCLLQGTKAYGGHVRPIPLPSREDRDELRALPNFYWLQEDYLREKQRSARWSWTILRPQIIFGEAIGAAMNLIPAIGAYAAILKDRGEPLFFPGGAHAILEAVDADLLARAIAWAGDTPAARNQLFNVTNGDIFTWRGVWPAIAEALGMVPGPAVPRALGKQMPLHADDWNRIRARHGLVAPELGAFVGESFHYADFTMGYGAPTAADAISGAAIVSTVKLRQAGFHEVMDTEVMLRKWFQLFQQARLLPAP
jgi:nucleoside-diphosphate-sugar epimerase